MSSMCSTTKLRLTGMESTTLGRIQVPSCTKTKTERGMEESTNSADEVSTTCAFSAAPTEASMPSICTSTLVPQSAISNDSINPCIEGDEQLDSNTLAQVISNVAEAESRKPNLAPGEGTA